MKTLIVGVRFYINEVRYRKEEQKYYKAIQTVRKILARNLSLKIRKVKRLALPEGSLSFAPTEKGEFCMENRNVREFAFGYYEYEDHFSENEIREYLADVLKQRGNNEDFDEIAKELFSEAEIVVQKG